ncbi:MAG: 50S ribosomal protein L28 [bacterium]|uniref:Large ribosomal subunit protein bL28 n=2 Tax=Bacteria candidate phyla TaxID=1783234 RepID=A0A101I4A2_UNCT6|nr:MAG: 50S ribosomal protein L28 [candidate division TA06 bacterium 32_111]KUK88154.1 MAG: 50S ribosomal protein L28 [candidate division TA06 bacterium 34_109]MDI6700955.1 50S ribosomal protein L28 [bacterium]HAF07084.1 50S ribosomal protein L28 [candidate division WOR-3 bacterium]HCP16999.1 50S ribosomal protein L28 [candidate division WOR-3 bacterium]
MANRCEICGKGPQFGSSVSHAHNETKKKRMPNLRRVKAKMGSQVKYIYVCSRCLRSGAVKKVV